LVDYSNVETTSNPIVASRIAPNSIDVDIASPKDRKKRKLRG